MVYKEWERYYKREREKHVLKLDDKILRGYPRHECDVKLIKFTNYLTHVALA